MIRVTAHYRWHAGGHFDHAYYTTRHMPMTRELLAPLGVLRVESDRVLHPGEPAEGDLVAATHCYFPTLAQARAALAAVGPALQADVPRYTTLRPQLLLCDVTSHA